jgi:hypothetical protein
VSYRWHNNVGMRRTGMMGAHSAARAHLCYGLCNRLLEGPEEGRECMNGRLHPESPNPLFATLDLLEYREGYGSGT